MSIPEVIDKIISLCAKRGISMDNLKTKDSEQLVQEVTVEQENVQPEATVEVATLMMLQLKNQNVVHVRKKRLKQ